MGFWTKCAESVRSRSLKTFISTYDLQRFGRSRFGVPPVHVRADLFLQSFLLEIAVGWQNATASHFLQRFVRIGVFCLLGRLLEVPSCGALADPFLMGKS